MENITDKEYRDLLDNTLINLKMISEIQENDKSYIEEEYLKLINNKIKSLKIPCTFTKYIN